MRYNRMLEGLRGEGTALPLIVFTLAGQIRSLIMIRKGLGFGQASHAIDESGQEPEGISRKHWKVLPGASISSSWCGLDTYCRK